MKPGIGIVCCYLGLLLVSIPLNIFAQTREITFRSAIRYIEKNTDYRFSYESDLPLLKQKVSKPDLRKSLPEMLKPLFQHKDFTYKIIHHDIIIIRRKNPPEMPLRTDSWRIVKGSIKDTYGQPLPGASVVLESYHLGTVSDHNGNWNLKLPSDTCRLIFSSLGYESREIIPGEQQEFQIILHENTLKLNEVVVTALGISKSQEAIGFSVQKINGRQLTKAREPNALSSLTGRVAGLLISNSPDLFVEPKAVLRGKEPLIVVDGVPIDTDAWSLNADDVESYTILKGPTAAALYGSKGQAGAIQITTRRGTYGRHKLSVEINTSLQIHTGFNAVPDVQHEYGPGSRGKYAFGDGPLGEGGTNHTDYEIWGPRFEGQLIPQWDSPIDPATGKRQGTAWLCKGKNNLKNFLNNGLLSTNNLALHFCDTDYNFRLSLSKNRQRGLVPNTGLNTDNLNFSGEYKFTPHVDIDLNLNHNLQYTDNYPTLGYGPANVIHSILLWNGSHYDIRDLRNYWYPGMEDLQQRNVEYYYFNNPWFVAYEQLIGLRKNNLYGYCKLNYRLNNFWKLHLRTYLNYTRRKDTQREPYSFRNGRFEQKGYYAVKDSKNKESDTDMMLFFQKTSEQWDLNASWGANFKYEQQITENGNTNGGLITPGDYRLTNSIDCPTTTRFNGKRQVISTYLSVDFRYRFLYLALTGRLDKSSALPINDNCYFYPSASLSILLSNWLSLPEWFSLFKIRNAWARVGSDFQLYNWKKTWTYGNWWNDLRPIENDGTLYDEREMAPDFSSSFESGVELGFWNNRLEINYSFYRTLEGPAVFSEPVSATSGVRFHRVNELKKKMVGHELVLSAQPIKSPEWNWDFTLNWARMREYLCSAGKDAEQYYHIKNGQRTDQYWRTVFQRTPSGELVYDDAGFPVTDPYPRLAGYLRPSWSMGMIHTLRYRNVNLSVTIDGKLGGKIWNQVEYHLWRSGRHAHSTTPERYDEAVKGIKSQTGQGMVTTSGEITYDGEGNILSDTRQFAPNRQTVYYSDWVKRYYNHDHLLIDKTFFKVREVIFTYDLSKWLSRKQTCLHKASISFVARNLFYFSKNRSVDLDAYTDTAAETELQTPSVKSFGINLNLSL